MIDAWLISSVVLSGLLVLLKNKIDLLLVFYLSTFLYHHGIIFNYIYTGHFNEIPNLKAKGLVAMVFTSLLLVQTVEWLIPKKIIHSEFNFHLSSSAPIGKLFKVFLLISLVATFLFIFSAGADIFAGKAASKNSALPYSFWGSVYFAYACSGYFLLTKRYQAFAVTVCIILFYVFVGTRAFAVLFFVNIFLLLSVKVKLLSKTSLKLFLLGVMVFVFFATYKHFYIALKNLDVPALTAMFSNITLSDFIWMMFSAEWAQVSMNTNRVTLLENWSLYSFWDMLFATLPPGFSGWSDLPHRFSEVIFYHANPGYSYGLGGAFWAEIWYSHGLVGIFIFSQILLWYVVFCNSLLSSGNWYYLYHAPLVIFIVFYLPRNDFSLLIGSIKNLIISIFLGLLVSYLLPWRNQKRRIK